MIFKEYGHSADTACAARCDGGSGVLKILYYVVIPLTHHKNSGYTELRVLGVGRSIILLFIAILVGVLKG